MAVRHSNPVHGVETGIGRRDNAFELRDLMREISSQSSAGRFIRIAVRVVLVLTL